MSEQENSSKKRTRSRFGCHRCKRLKVKCDETKPACSLCVKAKHDCDYTIKLTWGGRPFKKQKQNNLALGTIVSFDEKYNQDSKKNGDSNVQETIIRFASPSKQHQSGQKKLINAGAPQVTTGQEKKETMRAAAVTHEPAEPILSHIPRPGDSMRIDALFDISSPAPFDMGTLPNHTPMNNALSQSSVMTFSDQSPLYPLDGPDTPVPNNNKLMAAFRELETSNPMAKQFINNILLPEFTALDQNLRLGSDDDSSPENLVFMENFHTFNSTPDSPSELFTNPLKFFTGFETIPEALEPLPDLLQRNPLYRKHYHSYIEVFSKMLCPAPPSGYKDNPFTCILPKMSLSAGTEGILSILICFGLCQSTSYKHDPYPKELVKDLVRRALNDLYNRLTDPREASSDYTLALILVMTSFEIICGKEHGWRAHYFGAKNIMLSRGFLKSATKRYTQMQLNSAVPVSLEKGAESDLSFFFMRWFAYLDVIGALSSSSTIYTESGRAGDFVWETPSPTQRDREKLKDIDPFMGFDLKLLEHFSRIINLVKEREMMYSSAETLSVSIIQQALEAKEALLQYLDQCDAERDAVESRLKNDSLNVLNDMLPDYRVLRSTNEVFGLSGVLQIYRRVLMLPRQSPLVQDLVTRITHSIAAYINKEQPAAYCTVFSLFSTGCEVIDDKTRAFILDRVTSLADNGLLSARIAQEIMLESWDTGKYWADIIADRKIDVVFL